MHNSRMNGRILGVTKGRRGKAQVIIGTVGTSLMILVFIIQHIMSKYNAVRVNFDNNKVEDRSEIDGGSDIPESINILQMLDRSNRLEPFSGEKLIHLDLKGAPPLVSFYKELFPFLKRLGATGILMEYEDMFTYRDELEEIRARNAYTSADIREILRLADDNDLFVIPLVQTMGHLEFVLKLPRFRELREVDDYPQNLCPSQEKVQFLVEKMIDQVMEAHPKARRIHIGCDEVFFPEKCARCKAVMRKNIWTRDHLFINHVKRTAMYINQTYPGVRPIMWSDMLHHVKGEILDDSRISHLVDIMVWDYCSKVSDSMTPEMLQKLAKHFKSIWIASAFKGTTTASSIIPNTGYHLANHMSWMAIVTWWKKTINFKGIALTGWQRYDHFATLCELLPVGLPSLALSLLYIQNPSAEDHKVRLIKFLRCQSVAGFDPPDFHFSGGQVCDFPGFKIFHLVHRFVNLTSRLKSTAPGNMMGGWFSMYNVVHKFTSPYYVEEIFRRWPLESYLDRLESLEAKLIEALSEVYDEHTVREWIETHLMPVKMRLIVFLNARDAVLGQREWHRRPFATGSALENSSEICGGNENLVCALLTT